MNSYYISRIIIDGERGKIEFVVNDSRDNYNGTYIVDIDCCGIPYIMNMYMERIG